MACQSADTALADSPCPLFHRGRGLSLFPGFTHWGVRGATGCWWGFPGWRLGREGPVLPGYRADRNAFFSREASPAGKAGQLSRCFLFPTDSGGESPLWIPIVRQARENRISNLPLSPLLEGSHRTPPCWFDGGGIFRGRRSIPRGRNRPKAPKGWTRGVGDWVGEEERKDSFRSGSNARLFSRSAAVSLPVRGAGR